MRFSTATLLALPVLAAAAQDGPIEQAQQFIGSVLAWIPLPQRAYTAEPTPPEGSRGLNILTLDNWKDVILSGIPAGSPKTEEWWILVTGKNRTCWGRCGEVEKAFNETAKIWATSPDTPHLGYVDCDNEPVLCNTWGAGAPCIWWLDVPAPPGHVDVRSKGLNITTTTSQTFLDHWASQDYKKLPPYEGYFHPFDGQLAKLGLAVPLGYVFWFLAVVPSWLFMIGISFVSRGIMNRRAAAPQGARRHAAPAAAPAARARKNK